MAKKPKAGERRSPQSAVPREAATCREGGSVTLPAPAAAETRDISSEESGDAEEA